MKPARDPRAKSLVLALVVAGLAYLELAVVLIPLPSPDGLLLALAPAFGAGAIFYRESAKPTGVRVEDLLKAMVRSLYPKEAAAHYRANVMLHDKKTDELTIQYAHNMDGYVDRYTKLRPGEGCAGQAFVNGDVTAFDFTQTAHSDFGVDTRTTPIWADLRSILSVPIREGNGAIGGVLSIDTDVVMDQTGFHQSDMHRVLGTYAELIANLLEGG